MHYFVQMQFVISTVLINDKRSNKLVLNTLKKIESKPKSFVCLLPKVFFTSNLCTNIILATHFDFELSKLSNSIVSTFHSESQCFSVQKIPISLPSRFFYVKFTTTRTSSTTASPCAEVGNGTPEQCSLTS